MAIELTAPQEGTRESKYLGGNVLLVKEAVRNDVPVGIIEGYIATWDLDRGDWWYKDKFQKGAFLESIAEHKKAGRQVRFKDHHGRTVGGFPIETVKEDDTGLFGIAEVNLNVQQGREVYELAKQGVLSDFSIGFSVQVKLIEEQEEGRDIRTIVKATIWEGSIVDEPMNPAAVVTAVKETPDPPKGEKEETVTVAEVESWGKQELERALHDGTKLSKKAAKLVASKMLLEKHEGSAYTDDDLSSLLSSISSIKADLENR